MSYQAPEVEYLRKAVDHIKQNMLPEIEKTPRADTDTEEVEDQVSEEAD